jgi:hypothetical protein
MGQFPLFGCFKRKSWVIRSLSIETPGTYPATGQPVRSSTAVRRPSSTVS